MLSQYVIMKVKTNRILIDLLSLVRSNVRIKKKSTFFKPNELGSHQIKKK